MSSSNSDSDAASSGDEINFGSFDPKEFNYRVKLGVKSCTCIEPVNDDSVIGIILQLGKDIIVPENVNCMLDSIISCCNYALSNFRELNNPYRLAFADHFYKLRHEILFKLLMLTLNLPTSHSDVPFSDFGIESNRTPDYIRLDNQDMLIIEVAVTSNFEKTAMMKGLASSGYESKYHKEIELLRAKGYNVEYSVIIFDMSSYNVSIHQAAIKKIESNFYLNNYYLSYLDLIYREFCTITYNMKEYLYPVSTFLFTESVPIYDNHEELEFLYDKTIFEQPYHYQKITVSVQVYSKINQIWHRIPTIYESFNKDFKGSFVPVLSLTNNRLGFEEHPSGLDFEQMRDIIMTNDKSTFFNKLMLNVGTSKFPAMGSETGIDFIEKVRKHYHESIEQYNMPYLTPHKKIPVKRDFNSINHYELIVDKIYNSFFNPRYFDEDYEDLFMNKIKQYDNDATNNTLRHEDYQSFMKLGLLQENELSKVKIKEKMDQLIVIYNENNDFNESIPVKIQRMKQSFILPIANLCSKDYSSLKNKNVELLSSLFNFIDGNEFTKAILMKVLSDDFQFHTDKTQPSEMYLKVKKDKYDVCNKMTHLYKKYIRMDSDGGVNNYNKKLKDCNLPEIVEEYKELKKAISLCDKSLDKLAREEGLKQNIEFIRLPTKNRTTILGSYFQAETAHFKSKKIKVQSTIEGFGIPDNEEGEFEYTQELIRGISDEFVEYRGENPDMLVDMNTYEDVRLLKELKEKSLNDYRNLINEIKDSYLGHSCSFISRLAHSLMYYSQMSFNSDYIRVDNLGYSNVLLIIRGGKKIFKSKSSKMFRIFFPVSANVLPFYIDGGIGPSNYLKVEHKGETFLLSPWMMLHESILSDSISFYSRVTSFCALNSDPKINFPRQINKYLVNVMLAFHNRRQTEVLLANMRYILLSTMGDYSGIMQIFNDFCEFNYDRFQFFIRSSIFKNYPDFFTRMRLIQSDPRSSEAKFKELGVKNIFTNNVVENVDGLTLMIYSTFLMTKGPYQRPAERAINLLGMLNIHDNFGREVGFKNTPHMQLEKISISLNTEMSWEDYSEGLFKNDFMIDPKYICSMGVFANSYFENLKLKDNMQVEWMKILNKEWDSMATSTGLRGRPEDVEDFWGKKGYFVVYKFLMKTPDYQDGVNNLLSSNVDDNGKQKLLRLLNQTYLSKLDLIKDKGLLFHAVDKVQWRGSREIFVMDLDTKLMQQPIEKMMAYLCKNVDNELISIPSDKRAQVIHHTIFEKDIPLRDALTWFLTLDCSKWAPKSMFIKFSLMLTAMPILPPSFVCHFLNYSQKLFYKKIYFNIAEVNVLKNNPLYTDMINEYLDFDEALNGYYMLMPYSWVMGIFNYTSSFMHAFNQKYASYLINKSSSQNFGEETRLVMFAHSDDSGGRITSISKNLIERGLVLYEIQLKCCNHLLSKKKSVVSKIYFEILSIIYLFKKLLALLPKFLGGIRFTPTDKGPCQDMLQSYSKCTEIMVAGGDFSIAYFIMKFYSMMVWRFYYNRQPIESDYNRPVQYFGMPDSHPLMVLLTGSDSDILRMISTGNSKALCVIHSLLSELNLNDSDEGIIRPLKFNIKVRNVQKGFENYIENFSEKLKSWTLGNVNFKKSPFNVLNFLKKLGDPGFVGSLVNETPVRRISRSYYIRKGDSVVTNKGFFTLNEVITSIRLTEKFLKDADNCDLEFIKNMAGEDYIEKLNQLMLQDDESTALMKVMRNVLSGPLKICGYFNKLSLEGKEYRTVSRTLKPTQLQLLKSGASFSINFDAAQLVSYIKEPEYRWALPDLKNLPTAEYELNKLLFTLDLTVEQLDEATLLKLIRMHVSKTHKDIYLYSQIPGEIRSVKTYAAMLVFLSTNSFKNTEISGLSLKLKTSLTDPGYLDSTINDDVYYLNTLCSIIIMMLKNSHGIDMGILRIKPIEIINWKGGSMNELINFLSKKKFSMVDFEYISLYVDYIVSYLQDAENIQASILRDQYFYTFLKEQRKKGGWYGSGQLLISTGKEFFILNVLGSNIVSVESNHKGKINTVNTAFLMEICKTCGINLSANYMLNNNKIETTLSFGFDHVNELSIADKREINKGVPFFFVKRTPLFLNQLDFSSIKHIRENLFICEGKINEEYKSYKIYGLKINKTNVIETIEKLFYPKDFENVLIEEGIDNLNEFIMTELLTDFGEDIMVNKEEFFDSIFSSEAYKIFSEVKKSGLDILPKTIRTARFPAEEGSLPRILLAYGEITNISIIKAYKNYDPAMLSIRSEYPEGFSLILCEKLVECHRNLFTREEDKEMLQAYHRLSKIEDKESMRKQLINLMCYWGYGSLVNAINVYDFIKKKENYSLIKIINNKTVAASYINDIFKKCINLLINCMIDFSSYYDSLEVNVKGLGNNLNVKNMLKQYVKYLSCIGYKYKHPINFIDIQNVYFFNALSGFLKLPEFCDRLIFYFSKEPLLNTLPIDYNYKKEFFAFLNTMKSAYYIGHSIDYDLNYIDIVDRMPDNIQSPINISANFSKGLISTKEMVYHHGFLNNYLVSKFKSNITLNSGNKVYHIKQKISELSDVAVPVNDIIEIIRPLNEEFLEGDVWDDLSQELTFADIDEDTITDLWSEAEDQYVKRDMHFRKNNVYMSLNWVILPYNEGRSSFKKFLRQIGENVALITTSFVNMSGFPNTHTFLTNFSEIAGGDLPDTFVHVFGNKSLNKQFWKDLLGDNDIKLQLEQLEPLYLKTVNTETGLAETSNLGAISSEKILEEDYDTLIREIKERDKDCNKVDDEIEINDRRSQLKSEINRSLDKAVAEKIINKEIAETLRAKYYSYHAEKGLKIEDILSSLLDEIDLNMLNNIFLEALSGGITKAQVVKIFQTPEHFGVTHSTDRTDKNPITNSKLRAELEALCVGLSCKIASGSLTVSKNIITLVKSSFKIWKTYVSATSYKKENKKFLLKLMNSIINSAVLVDDVTDDSIWNSLINNVQVLIAQDEEENDTDDEDYIRFDYNISNSSRLKYRFSGYF